MSMVSEEEREEGREKTVKGKKKYEGEGGGRKAIIGIQEEVHRDTHRGVRGGEEEELQGWKLLRSLNERTRRGEGSEGRNRLC